MARKHLLILLFTGAILTMSWPADAQRPGRVRPQPRWLPDSLELTADIPYADTDNPRQRLDLLLPTERKSDKPLPVIAFIHGGAWRAGDKSGGIRRVAPFAKTGEYAVVSIGYRLTDEAQWPEQSYDCKAAIRWIRAHAEKYQLDADKIGIWGTSAGGHLVAMLGTSGDVEKLEGTLGSHTDQSSRVACVVDFFGPTDFVKMNAKADKSASMDHDSARSPESLLIGGPIQEHLDKVATASPLTYVTNDDPPFLIVHGTRDPLVAFNQSELLHEALQKVEVPSTLITIEGAGHGQGFPPETMQLVRKFFDHQLRGIETQWNDQTLQAQSAPARQ
ncbi:alpha/beta hydrolase [Aeoliella mucimassa]|uniref:Para-nitrobenzyl esterase n=1 Tax=Aeoliella mucimassa TaxID=2527972 RepID=A0A518ARF5_9BACT|nr:alpha/beta hydrolase [Aeoliella mucimassa]QDU57310.1 Para-nitrobenzyl esterase [Aeoliella mucimassa]